MKIILFISIIFTAIQLNSTVIKGTITGENQDFLILKFNDYYNLGYESITHDTLLIKDRKFNQTIKVDSFIVLSFYNQNDEHLFQKKIFLIKDDTLDFDFNVREDNNYFGDENSLIFNSGKTKEINEFIQKLNFFNNSYFIELFQEGGLYESLHLNDSLKNYFKGYIEDKKDLVSPTIYKYMLDEFNISFESNETEILLRKGYWANYEPSKDTFDISYFGGYKDRIKTYSNISSVTRFGDLLEAKVYKDFKYNNSLKPENEKIKYELELELDLKINLFIEYLEGFELDKVIYDAILTKIDRVSKLDELERINSYVVKSDKINLKKELLENIEDKKKILPGNISPEITLNDLDGNSVSLSDFKGKIVYLDFWFWGCTGCMMELPFAKTLHKRYENKDIVFLNVSSPGKEYVEREIKLIKKDKIEGINLIDGDRYYATQYQVKAYPTYFIIDKDGKIAVPNAPRPSEENDLYTILDELLEK